MKSLLMRTGSMPVQTRFIPTTISRHNSVESLSTYGDRFSAGKISIDAKSAAGMRRALSESDVIRSERMSKSVVGSKPSPARIPEEEEEGFSGGGGGGSGFSGGDGGGYEDRRKIGDYYREMLKSNPNSSLLLMNYGKFLYEVERDLERAEEYYGRAILADPGDGEALSMYGKLIWETKRDEERAQCYFDQAVNASPDDCMVLGSYAHFMWEAEDDDEEEEELMVGASPALV
ncbi:unnamed protein product [Brassica rapa]|uniref:Uncharacterized protein n=1 Tax=Brassica campestris TaxID=3711 RepID=A0A3P5ZQ38_BRACM|nr:unnamed protein product [Brassica rapa]VDC74440.1 unnamed protein product [Brassica rapa]